MAKKDQSLLSKFQPDSYDLLFIGDTVHLKIIGRKLPPPSKRIALHQKALKVTKAKIVHKAKKEQRELEVIRINHLSTFQQVRLHTKEILYPGEYEIRLEYKTVPQTVAKLKANGISKPNRELMPSVDEAEAWEKASVGIKQ